MKNRSKKQTKVATFDKSVCSLRDLRIADLDLFVTAARLKNLGQAAEFHHLSQSAASVAVQRVERAFGASLCYHERRQFRLTKEGQLWLPKAENWLKTLQESVIAGSVMPIRLATTHAIARVSVPVVLPMETLHLTLLRPDYAYSAVLRDEADVALVLDNAPWEGVIATEVGKGLFQLYSSRKEVSVSPVMLPEDQIEVLTLQQRWQQMYQHPLAIKARLPSWSLIADICGRSEEVGFLPDFLARQVGLLPVSWQPPPSRFRILALYREHKPSFQKRIDFLLEQWKKIFTS